MKLSVSLPDDDVATLDEHVRNAGLSSRSAAIRQAIRLLRQADLEDQHLVAWDEWQESGAAQVWEAAAGDGLT